MAKGPLRTVVCLVAAAIISGIMLGALLPRDTVPGNKGVSGTASSGVRVAQPFASGAAIPTHSAAGSHPGASTSSDGEASEAGKDAEVSVVRMWHEDRYQACTAPAFSFLRSDGILAVECRGEMRYRYGYQGSLSFWSYSFSFPSAGEGEPPFGGSPELNSTLLPEMELQAGYAELALPAHVEYVYVTCIDEELGMLYNLHRNIHRSPGAGKKAIVAQPWPENAGAAEMEALPELAADHNVLKPNIMLLWVDSLARAKFMRDMPETAGFLEAMVANPGSSPMQAFDFTRFHVVDQNSWPNIMALMCNGTRAWGSESGTATEYIAGMAKHNESFVVGEAQEIAQCLFHSFKRDHGYATAIAQQTCNLKFLHDFFRRSPHWPGPDHELGEAFCNPTFKYAGGVKCIVGELAHNRQFDVMHKLLDAYAGAEGVGAGPMPKERYAATLLHKGISGSPPQPYEASEERRIPLWAVVAFNEFHHNRALPVWRQFDRDMVANLQRAIFRHGHNSIFIVFADHGLHYGKWYKKEKMGQKEHHLPFMYILVGKPILAACPRLGKMLKDNRRALFTANDMFTTMHHLPRYLRECGMEDTATQFEAQYFGGLLNRINPSRTLSELGVPSQYRDSSNTNEDYDIREMVDQHMASRKMNKDLKRINM